MGNSSKIHGSVANVVYRPTIRGFNPGWTTRWTLVPSSRITFSLGDSRQQSSAPKASRTMKAAYVPSVTVPELLSQFCPIVTAAPITAPRLKSSQVIAMARPFWFSVGYD